MKNKIDQDIDKNPTEITHPVLKLDLLEKKPDSFLAMCETVIDILDTIFKLKSNYDRLPKRTDQTS